MELYRNTVSDLLWVTLKKLMLIEEFNSFRLVGGTSLSLQLGHRESVDIGLFTDADYGSIDFVKLENIIRKNFAYVENSSLGIIGMGTSFFIGDDKNELVKLDLFYTEPFVFPIVIEQNIRFASTKEIVAMKMEVIAHGGRKKDFWDLHELLNYFTINEIVEFYLKRNPYCSTKNEIMEQLVDFTFADDDFTPNCFKNKDWEIIKLDFEDLF